MREIGTEWIDTMAAEPAARERLEQAAGELLVALKELLAWANIPADTSDTFQPWSAHVARQARAAIAKAEGETP